jgi:hypothetical protein
VIIEKYRKDLLAKREEEMTEEQKKKAVIANQMIKDALERTARISPAKLFLNFKELRAEVLAEVGKGPEELRYKDLKDPQLQKDLDELIILQERRFQEINEVLKMDKSTEENKKLRNQLLESLDKKPLDFDQIEDASQRARVQNLATLIRKIFCEEKKYGRTRLDEFIDNLANKDWKVPYVFGTEDLPYNLYNFASIGGTGIHRIWRDNTSGRNAALAISELIDGMPNFKTQEDIVKVLAKIHSGIAGYDKSVARDITKRMAEGVMKFYNKNWISRLPFGIGTLASMVTGRASYAQYAFGRGAMAWDELESNEFTRLLRDRQLISEEEQHELQRKAGGGRKEVAAALLRTVVPLIMLALIYYLLSKTIKEK